jgi:DNA-binding MarR family transcriptional regulator
MANTNEGEELFVSTVEVDGHAYNVTVLVEHDGIEYVGHLWFSDADWDDDEGVRDHGPVVGATQEEIVRHVRALSEADLAARYRRALAERRRFHGLRQITQDVLSQIRYLNKVATSMRAGLIDLEEAASEIDSTEQRLHEMVGQLRLFAGVVSS